MTDPPAPPPRIAVWCAVSSESQAAETKSSLHDQEAEGRRFAAALSAPVVRLYVVPGHTRDLIFWADAEATMDAYRLLRLDCESHAFDVLWAADPDRLGRDPALSNQVISLVARSGAEVYFASAPHPIGHASTSQRYVYAFQSIRAKEDQELRTHRLMQGIAARVRRGLPANHWPLGYLPTLDPTTGSSSSATLDPDLAPAVTLATRLFLEGQPFSQIVAALNRSPYHPPRARLWTYSVVHKMLHNDAYAGFPAWGDVHYPGPDPSPCYPPLWDSDTHARLLRERARRAGSPRRKRTGSPLSGLIFCGRCGYAMIRHRNRSGSYSLCCSKHNRKARTGEPCHKNFIPEARVIQAITARLVQLSDPAALDDLLATHDAAPRLQEQLDQVHRHVERTTARRRRLALALASGALDPQMYRTTDDQLLAQLDGLHTELSRLEQLRSATPDPSALRDAILHLASALPALVAQADPLHVRTLMQNAGLHIKVESGAITSLQFAVY